MNFRKSRQNVVQKLDVSMHFQVHSCLDCSRCECISTRMLPRECGHHISLCLPHSLIHILSFPTALSVIQFTYYRTFLPSCQLLIDAVLQRHSIRRSTVSKSTFQVGLHSFWAAQCLCSKQEDNSGSSNTHWLTVVPVQTRSQVILLSALDKVQKKDNLKRM